jgi:hypothetical protein
MDEDDDAFDEDYDSSNFGTDQDVDSNPYCEIMEKSYSKIDFGNFGGHSDLEMVSMILIKIIKQSIDMAIG